MKNLSLILAVVLLFAMVSCRRGDVAHTPTVTTEETVTTAGAEVESTEKTGSSYSVVNELDEAMNRELEADSTTAGMVDINVRYAEKWQALADEYYEKLMDYESSFRASSEDFHGYISDLKTNWEEYYAVECETYNNIIHWMYDPGTIVPVLMSEHSCELTREWTIELIDIAYSLGIE